MADELKEIDDINLDEFNFDDLPDDLAETPVDENAAAESMGQQADDFDFGDLSSEDFNFDDILSDNTASDNDASQQEEVVAESNDENLAIEEISPMTEVDEFEVQEDEATFAAFDEAGTGIEAQNIEMEAGVELPSDEERQDPFFEDKTEESEVAMDTALFDEQDASAEDTVLFDEQDASAEDTVFDDNDDVVPTENEVPLSEDLVAEELPEEVEQINNTTVDSDLVFEETMVEPPLASDDNILPEEFSNDEIENAHEEFFAGEEAIAEATPLDYNSSFDNGYSAAASIEEPDNAGYLKWFSGHSNDKMFEVGKGFESGNFDADEERKTLHVNVGYDTYGWEVQFSDGVVMNLRDVREYQIRNGRLPNPDGRLIYGRSTLLFSGVERIVVYESVKYFSYGI